MKLKIAFCFCTEIRDGNLLSESIKSFMQNNDKYQFDIDYYLHTWDHTYLKEHNNWEDGIKSGILKEYEFKRRIQGIYSPLDLNKLDKFIKAYNIKKYKIDNEFKSLNGIEFPSNYLWQSLRFAFELIDEPQNYDILIYSRPDICFPPDIKFVDFIEHHLSEINNTIFHHELFFFFSTPNNVNLLLDKIVKKYNTIPDNINDYFGKEIFKTMEFNEKYFLHQTPAMIRPENLHLNPITDFDEFCKIDKVLYA